MTSATASTVTADKPYDEDAFDHFSELVRAQFLKTVGTGVQLFTTSADQVIVDAYLSGFPADVRQVYNCTCCKHFLRTYGALVTIDQNGDKHSVMWSVDDVPELYKEPLRRMLRAINDSVVTGAFVTSEARWGTPVSAGDWHHLAVVPPASMVHKDKVLTAYQVATGKREDYRMLGGAIASYPLPVVEQAVTLLDSETLYRSEKVIGIAKWFLAVQRAAKHAATNQRRQQGLWVAAATAPAGFCHVRSSMIGTLLDDLAAGKDLGEVKRAFVAKMNPLQYQRPQAAPAAGNIAQAEKLVEKLGIKESLRRRFARLDEVQALWRPTEPEAPAGGGSVFGHLTPKDKPAPTKMVIPGTQSMTWEKFRRTMLGDALKIEVQAPFSGPYCQLVSAADMDAPPIVQWDLPERRNPVTWYVYSGGAQARQFNVTTGWVELTAVALQPSMWHDESLAHHGRSLLLLIKGCRDTNNRSLSLFPELLKSELREVRATIEAHSKSGRLEQPENEGAGGLKLEDRQHWSTLLRVTTKDSVALVKLDRWD